jgi:hypothetical protein
LEYHDFYSYMVRTGTEILFDYQCSMKGFALYEGVELCCRYPADSRRSRNSLYLEQLCNGAALQAEALGEIAGAYRDTCNASSSIWTLENSGRTIALFAGDSTVETMSTIFPLPKGPPEVFKLSHHGINRSNPQEAPCKKAGSQALNPPAHKHCSPGKSYFSVEQIRAINPRKSIVICVSSGFYESIQHDCDELCSAAGTAPHYTFNGDYTCTF